MLRFVNDTFDPEMSATIGEGGDSVVRTRVADHRDIYMVYVPELVGTTHDVLVGVVV